MSLVLESLLCYHSPLCGGSAVFETGSDQLLEASLPLRATGLSRMARCSASRFPRNQRRRFGQSEVRCRRSDARDTHDNMTSSVHVSLNRHSGARILRDHNNAVLISYKVVLAKTIEPNRYDK